MTELQELRLAQIRGLDYGDDNMAVRDLVGIVDSLKDTLTQLKWEHGRLHERFRRHDEKLVRFENWSMERSEEVTTLKDQRDQLRSALWQFDNHEERTPETTFCAGCDLGEWDEEAAPEELHDDDCRAARAALAQTKDAP